ncbi:MAG: type IV pilin N-terminal domain-containing protein [Euryarchaeota archaeon]|nr:type IV pilin N-terminal domain-containing protein [Euryarchaeota archaeon]
MGKMKANRKFINGEEAVSAVIGVILMVAITVAIAATVYVYVSGMLPGPSSSNKSVGSILVSSHVAGNRVTYKVTQTDSGIPWSGVVCKFAKSDGTGPKIATHSGAAIPPANNWTYGAGANIAVGDYFTVNVTGDGSWIIDLVYTDSILWSSPAVTV